ncbi:MAG: hypothetical protein ABJ327_03125 [Litoreibacter sp.]
MKHIALIAVLALPASAETILSPQEFEAFVQNSTVYFDRYGTPYGSEQYLRNRKVIWSFANGECEFGEWFPREDQICFQYENQNTPLCWHFVEQDGIKRARVVGDDPVADLHIVAQDKQPVNCEAPNVGAQLQSLDPTLIVEK